MTYRTPRLSTRNPAPGAADTPGLGASVSCSPDSALVQAVQPDCTRACGSGTLAGALRMPIGSPIRSAVMASSETYVGSDSDPRMSRAEVTLTTGRITMPPSSGVLTRYG